MSRRSVDFFNRELAQGYDERNGRLAPVKDCLHFLTDLLLRNLPARSRVLCVGAGTGAEILALSRIHPEWSFVSLDPSAAMLEVCEENLRNAGVLDRCELVRGYVHELADGSSFDAVVSLFVGHFVDREERTDFFRHMTDRLRKGGSLVHAEISFELDSEEYPAMLEHWKAVQSLMGATPESLAGLSAQLRDTLTILPPSETEEIIRRSGIPAPMRFFQALMVCAWYGTKASEGP